MGHLLSPSEVVSAKTEYLVQVIQRLSLAISLDEITQIVRHAARELVDADGASFVLRDEDQCHYVDEEAIAPLWKGKKFPMVSCVSGWAMMNNDVAVIEDIYADSRVPHAAYRPTFVKSMVMTPIRGENPIGAIGTYWATEYKAGVADVNLLKALANSTSTALENVRVISDLKKSNEALSESLRSRDEFLSIAAHELRTPLSALQLQLQMMERDLQDPSLSPSSAIPELNQNIGMALRQTGKLGHLIEKLLDISRIRLDHLDLSFSEIALEEVVRSAVEQLNPTLKEAGCEIQLNLPKFPVRGCWDRLRIEQVVTNLISNACKYALGKPIEVELQVQGGDAILTVADHGAGIAEAAYSRIFDRFVRTTSASHVSGLGLGLFIVRSIVRAHGGDVSVSNREIGTGAIFTVRVPLDPLIKKEIGYV